MLMLFVSMLFSSLPLVSAVYTVEEHYMPPEPDDLEPVCAMKTRTDGYFYVPNVATDLLKIEMLFDNQNIVGDQTGGTSPYTSVTNWPDGYVNFKDAIVVGDAFGSVEGGANWDYMVDIIPDKIINYLDTTILGSNFGKSGTYITDLAGVAITFNTGQTISPDSDGFVTIPKGATSFTVKRNGTPIGAMVIFYGPREPPIAYSTTFEFSVPDDGGLEVWYYVLVRMYVPSELAGNEFYLFPDWVDDWIRNVKMNRQLKYSGGHPACQPPASVSLGFLGQGYHLLEFEYGEQWAYGILRFHVATASGQPAWLSRFRTYVPNYSNTKYEYTVKTSTILPIDDHYFLKGYADDFIDDLYLDGLYWQDWEWDMGPTYGVINAWGDGFLYPMGYRQKEPLDVAFTFGEKEGAGLLDFQFVSWTFQQSRIGNPIFWTKASAEEATPYLQIHGAKAWTGSKWTAEPGRSMRLISTTLRVLVNTTDPNTFHPAPQEAEVSLVLGWLDPAPKRNVVQDIGVMINLTYTYFIDGSLVYGMPIWFDAQSIEVRLAEQGSALYMPAQSIVFNTQSNNSFISPQWKVVGTASGMLINFFITSALYDTFGPAGAITGISAAAFISQLYNFFNNQELVSVQENTGNLTYRKFAYTDWFKTAESQQPLAKPVRSVCQGFFFRVYPFASGHCGLISINLKGNLWLPFFYVNPEYEYGTWLPVHVELQIAFPVFITD
jgi:hypothetical protein